MKTLITVSSLAAIGAIGLQAADTSSLKPVEKTKVWSVSASLRGFYDDNYTTLPSSAAPGIPTERDSFGFELAPRLSLNFPMEQTTAQLSYEYKMKYYEDREENTADHIHLVDGKIEHDFSDRYKMTLSDSFAVAQEPEVMDPDIATPLRTEGNNIRNIARTTFSADITEKFGVVLEYSNSVYDYEDSGDGSYSARLDRMQNLAGINLRYRVQPTTFGILGYQFSYTDQNSNDSLLGTGPFVSPDIRDRRSHYMFVGADHSMTTQLRGSVRVGAQYSEYPNAGSGPAAWNLADDKVSPYVDGQLSYAYTEGSIASLGIRHSKVQTDLAVLDQEATTVYGQISHKITAKLTGKVNGRYQHAIMGDGDYEDEVENYFLAGVSLNYQVNEFLSAETGYNFDRLDSDIPNRSYSRNRVFLGVRATY
ncbi:MAG: outer membrane beta-barrel protein [Verrucomicrobia bacterium]|nr:outer membrane beta-barrel protein [Verrucomicrobiota bacterium]MCF7708278.1 outer membrane beta-barrel protein [Verrucomicrobiota bacterium]